MPAARSALYWLAPLDGFLHNVPMQTLLPRPNSLVQAARRLQASWWPVVGRWVQIAVPLLLLGFLGYSLTRLGWGQVWDAKPDSLAFYLLLFAPFFVPPFAELLIYRNLLGRTIPMSVLLRKRYLNGSMLDYSGEAYFFFWARRNLQLRDGLLLHAVKDTNILSGGAGLAIAWFMLLLLVACEGMEVPVLPAGLWSIVSIGSLPLALCLALFVGGRRVTALTRGQMMSTFAIHLLRSAVALLIEFAIWWFSGALPSALACLEFVGLRLLISRLPLIPSKDLVFVGVGITAAGLMDFSSSKVAAALVLMTAFDQLLAVLLVGLPWLFDRSRFQNSVDPSSS